MITMIPFTYLLLGGGGGGGGGGGDPSNFIFIFKKDLLWNV